MQRKNLGESKKLLVNHYFTYAFTLPGKTRQFNSNEGHKATQPAATYYRKGKVLSCMGYGYW